MKRKISQAMVAVLVVLLTTASFDGGNSLQKFSIGSGNFSDGNGSGNFCDVAVSNT
jgi:DNA-binding transcriptional regulator of glucitol operon